MKLMNLEFEGEIEVLERKVRGLTNQDGLVVFYGSSSFRLWDTLKEDMAPLNALNLGFGGSSFSWCIYYFDRLFQHLKPSHVVIYVGDNDLANGLKPRQVLKKFQMLSRMVRMSYPSIPVDFITIKPSPIRTDLLPDIKLTNDLIRKELKNLDRSWQINVFDSMLDEKGVARPELYLEDQLHMNREGYKIWTGLLRKRFGI